MVVFHPLHDRLERISRVAPQSRKEEQPCAFPKGSFAHEGHRASRVPRSRSFAERRARALVRPRRPLVRPLARGVWFIDAPRQSEISGAAVRAQGAPRDLLGQFVPRAALDTKHFQLRSGDCEFRPISFSPQRKRRAEQRHLESSRLQSPHRRRQFRREIEMDCQSLDLLKVHRSRGSPNALLRDAIQRRARWSHQQAFARILPQA